MLQFLPYALAAYGGYKGYKASKDAGGSGLQRLLAGATGAAAGYYGGKGVLAGGSALNIPGFSAAQSSFTPFLKSAPLQSFAQTSAGQALGIPIASDGYGMGDEFARQTYSQQLAGLPAAQKAAAAAGAAGGPGGTPAEMNALQKLLFRQRLTKQGDFTGEMEFSPGKVAAAIATGTYLGGAFEPKPQDVYTPTYNLAVAELQKQRGGFKYIDPISGEEKVFEQPFIPEANRDPQYTQGPYELSKSTFNTGGLATIPKFNEGGVNFLPSKVTHDENDSNNYVRAQGYVEDGSGTGDKDEDTMLAQLADGEFVTRADGVLGAGIIAGANPESFKDMREKGASYFYEQQKRYKRVFDLLQGSKNAKAKVN
tara:strand:+ start:389 stop:1492 length:1104 start_codon:yes stop_codon:yes gene_type:complete